MMATVEPEEDREPEMQISQRAFQELHQTIARLTSQLSAAEKAAVSARNAVIELRDQGVSQDAVFFYERDFYVLSNFSAFRLHWRGHSFDTSEAAYHWNRFFLASDEGEAIAGMIESAMSAHEAFKIAQEYKARQRPDWDDVKVSLMRDILRAKANQHEYVSRKLMATGDKMLIENSWRDDFWGWGTNKDGKNMLGQLWMQIRAERRSLSTQDKTV